MRLALALSLIAAPALGWEFSPVPICTLSHETETAQVRVTYDAGIPEYTITVTRLDRPWPDAPVFSLRFDGPRGLTISTDRHSLSPDGRSLTVKDRGFGNVLDGLQFNDMATALIGSDALPVPLDGAAEPAARFRACPAAPTA